MNYLLDTNVISDYITAMMSENGRAFLEGIELNISVITELEVLCWKTKYEEDIKAFLATLNILDITQEVKLSCVSLRKKKKIKLPDAIIAATALAHGHTLVTDNEKDFQGIRGLKIVNPHKLK